MLENLVCFRVYNGVIGLEGVRCVFWWKRAACEMERRYGLRFELCDRVSRTRLLTTAGF